MNKRSRSLFFISTLPLMIGPIAIIVSCASTNTPPADNQSDNSQQSAKIAFVSTQIRLDLANENANNYAQENDLKTLIFNNKEKIFTNIPSDFSINNIFVSQIMANIPNSGDLQAQIEIKNRDTVLLEKTLITFTGFQKNVPALSGTEIELKDQTNVDPKTYKEESALKTFIFNKKDEIFKNLPNNLTENQINIEANSIKIRSGALILTLSVKATNTSDSDLIMPTKIKLTGFMATFAFKDETVKLSGLANEPAKDITEERLKEIVANKASEIFDTVPEGGVSKEQVLIEQKQRAFVVNGQKLTARVAIKEKNSETLLIDYETIVLTGFKITIGLNNQVDLTSKLESGEENLDQYIETDYPKLKALIYKNRNSFFSDWPEEFNENSFAVTETKIYPTEKGKLIVKVKVADPSNNGSDLISETEVFVSGFFDFKSDTVKLNFNLGEEYLGKYLGIDSVATDEQKQLMAKLIFNHQSEIFINIPSGLERKYKIEIKNIRKDSPEHLGITFSIFSTENNYFLLMEKEIVLGSFFYLNNLSPSLPISITLQLTDDEKPKDQYKNKANAGDEKMKNLISKYKDKIFKNLPTGFDQTWIQITKSATDVPGKQTQLNVGFKIVKDDQEILPEVDVIFDGFTA